MSTDCLYAVPFVVCEPTYVATSVDPHFISFLGCTSVLLSK